MKLSPALKFWKTSNYLQLLWKKSCKNRDDSVRFLESNAADDIVDLLWVVELFIGEYSAHVEHIVVVVKLATTIHVHQVVVVLVLRDELVVPEHGELVAIVHYLITLFHFILSGTDSSDKIPKAYWVKRSLLVIG